MTAAADADASEQAVERALRTIGLLFEPGDVIEIRALNVGRSAERAGVTYSGYFNFENENAIRTAIRRLDGDAEGVYVILNRFNPGLLARANNRLQARPRNTTSDLDIVERRWLYIDLDAIRAAGISATDEEHNAAIQRAIDMREYLRSVGWPDPVAADSGNGGHLLYRLPPLDLLQAGDLVKRCLKALNRRFSDSTVTVDESTATAARICKLYGTWTRKGDSMPDRPHRRAQILDEPETIEAVPVEALNLLADQAQRATPPPAASQDRVRSSDGFRFDQWLSSSGLEVMKGPDAYEGGQRWTLAKCPFNPEHLKPVIIQLPSGALCYRCLHKSCAQNDWKALRRLIDPGYSDHPRAPFSRATNDAASGPAENPDTIAPLITDLSQIPSIWSFESSLKWSVEGMFAEGSVTLLSAESGTGKTWLAYYIAGCVAHGLPIIGRRVKQSKVLYLDGENPAYVVKQRLFDLGIAATLGLTVWGGWTISPPPGPSHPLVVDFAHEHKGLIIYDSLIEFHPGSEQSSTETRAFMRQFRLLANLGATVLILHNAGKAETSKLYRGSSDIKAAVDTAYQLRATDDKADKLGKLYMNCFKGRLTPAQSFGLEFRAHEGFVPCEHSEPARTTEEIIAEILEANPNSNQKYVVAAAREKGCSKRQAEECLKHGPWRKSRGPNNAILYSLRPEEGPE
jgi:hypothetical protein